MLSGSGRPRADTAILGPRRGTKDRVCGERSINYSVACVDLNDLCERHEVVWSRNSSCGPTWLSGIPLL